MEPRRAGPRPSDPIDRLLCVTGPGERPQHQGSNGVDIKGRVEGERINCVRSFANNNQSATQGRNAVPTSNISTIDSDAPRQCDIVMKGGITSGVVYPKLVATLAREYQFRNVGGTSAGAIAAAATAAAEYGRQHGNKDAFDTLDQLPGLLSSGAKNAKGSVLFNLFQPVPPLKRHFGVLASMLNAADPVSRVSRGIGGLIFNFAMWAFAGSAVGLLPLAALYAWFDLGTRGAWAQGLAAAWCVGIAIIFALVISLLRFVFTARDGLIANDFGFCSGLATTPSHEGLEALTSWMFGYYQQLAGLPAGEALTFGHLWGPSAARDGEQRPSRNIDLQMMTTALNTQRPYAFPFRTREFYFDPKELARFFPGAVVTHLVDHTASVAPNNKKVFYRGTPLIRLPEARDLPVILGVRMSLSFPILLQTIPLYVVDYSLGGNQGNAATQLEATRVLFSDGGLCSNFPLHFFDALLPMRPTFAIDLTQFPPEHTDRIKDRVWMPKPNAAVHHYIPPLNTERTWNSLGQVLGSMLDAARCWRDNLQQDVPGYRERIVHVRQAPDEGGLNLNMPQPTIEALGNAGSAAADCLMDHFLYVSPPGQVQGWKAHEFIRLRSLLAVLQPNLTHLSDVARAHYASVVRWAPPPVYPFGSAPQQAAAEAILLGLAAVGAGTASSRMDLSIGAPRPAPDLEITAQP
jgi:predicted acylesterase/phospholipase RssA